MPTHMPTPQTYEHNPTQKHTHTQTTLHPHSPSGPYRSTVCLPTTPFDMRANSLRREPQLQQWWQEHKIYEQLSTPRDGAVCVRVVWVGGVLVVCVGGVGW